MATTSTTGTFRITVRRDALEVWKKLTGKTEQGFFSYMLKKAARLFVANKAITMEQVQQNLTHFQNRAPRKEYLQAFMDAKLHKYSSNTENRINFLSNVMHLFPAEKKAPPPPPTPEPSPATTATTTSTTNAKGCLRC